MTLKVSLGFDPILGTHETFHALGDGKYAVETRFDAAPTLDANKRAFNVAPTTWRNEAHRIASIPLPLYFDLKKQGIVDDRKKFLRWLSDPDNRHFRTKPGRIV